MKNLLNKNVITVLDLEAIKNEDDKFDFTLINNLQCVYVIIKYEDGKYIAPIKYNERIGLFFHYGMMTGLEMMGFNSIYTEYLKYKENINDNIEFIEKICAPDKTRKRIKRKSIKIEKINILFHMFGHRKKMFVDSETKFVTDLLIQTKNIKEFAGFSDLSKDVLVLSANLNNYVVELSINGHLEKTAFPKDLKILNKKECQKLMEELIAIKEDSHFFEERLNILLPGWVKNREIFEVFTSSV